MRCRVRVKTLKEIKESVLKQYKDDYPDEAVYGKIFGLYILDRYCRLMFNIYKKAGEKEKV